MKSVAFVELFIKLTVKGIQPVVTSDEKLAVEEACVQKISNESIRKIIEAIDLLSMQYFNEAGW